MAGELLNMNILDVNKHRCNLKDLCFKNRHKTIYSTLQTMQGIEHSQLKKLLYRFEMKRLYILFIIPIVLCVFCQSPVKTGVIQSSYNISASKERGVFVNQYIPDTSVVNLDKNKLQIQEVWVEFFWEYINQNREIRILDSKYGYVKFKDPDTDLFEIEFTYTGKTNGILGNKLSFNFDEYPDTLKLTFSNKNQINNEVVLIKVID